MDNTKISSEELLEHLVECCTSQNLSVVEGFIAIKDDYVGLNYNKIRNRIYKYCKEKNICIKNLIQKELIVKRSDENE